MQTTDATMEIEPNEIAPGNQGDAAHDGSPPIELQDADSKPSDRRFPTPERAPAIRRNVEGQVPHPKTRRLSEDVTDTGDGNNDALIAMGG